MKIDAKPIQICKYHLRLIKTTPRFILLMIMVLIYVHSIISPLQDFSKAVHIAATPWIFPFLTSNAIPQLLIMSGVLVLFCDAPFSSNMQEYLLIRSTKRIWTSGILLYIVSISFVYTTAILAFSILSLLPYLQFSMGWGKIIGTLTLTDASDQFSILIDFSTYILSKFEPLQATLIAFLLEWSCVTLLGLVIYVLNTLHRSLGTVVAAFWIFLDICILNVLPYSFTRISPLSLSKLGMLTGQRGFPTIRYSVVFYLVSIIGMSLFAILLSHRKTSIHNSK